MKKKSEKTFKDLRRRVARNLRRLRAAQGISHGELSELTGLHSRHLQKIEAGNSNVTLVTMACLASGLGVSPGELIATGRSKGKGEDIYRRISDNLARLCAERGLTLAQLAERAGVLPGDLSRIEAGQGDIPLTIIIDLAHVLSVDPVEIVARAKSSPKKR